jgi:lipopolysaccharide transport system permease protein
MKQELPETIYSPESQLLNLSKLLSRMYADLKNCRFLAWRLFVRNLSAQYRQTALGYIWLFLPPVATTVTWIFLNSQKILNIGVTDLPYPVFVLTGTLLWQGFVDALQAPGQQFQSSKTMLTKIQFPHEAILLAAMGGVLFNFLVRLVLLVLILFWYQIPFSGSMFLAPIGIFALLGLGFMVGVIMLPLAMLYGDIQRLVMLLTPIWFFLTPVVYPAPETWPASLLAQVNPASSLLITTRQWMTGSEVTHLFTFIIVTLCTIILSLLGWLIYRMAVPHLIERIGS